METQVTHLMFVHVNKKVISVDEPRTENEKDKRNTQRVRQCNRKIQYRDKHELSKRAGATKHGTMKGTSEHPPPWLKSVPGDAR